MVRTVTESAYVDLVRLAFWRQTHQDNNRARKKEMKIVAFMKVRDKMVVLG